MESRIEVYHTLLNQLNWNLNMCGLGKIDLDRYDFCQSGVTMILVDRYDHKIYYGEKK
jgi:hypothetical protein